MKTNQLLIFITFILALSSCNPKSGKPVEKDVVLSYYKRNVLHHSDSLKFSRIIKNDTIYVYYYDSIDTLAYSFQLSSKNDSSMFIFGVNCPLVAKKQYMVNGRVYWINKYYHDDADMKDEESIFFYTEDYGLLVLFNDAWGSLIYSLEYDPISRTLVDSILNDRTGFYKCISTCIPPPPEGVDEVIELIE